MDYQEFVLLSLLVMLMSDFLYSSAHIFGGHKLPTFMDMVKLNTGSSESTSRNVDPSQVEQISCQPRAFIYKRFLTNKECDHFMKLAKKGKLEKFNVIDEQTGQRKNSKYSTSSRMYLEPNQDEIVTGIEERIAGWTFFPLENGEPIKVERYENGEKFDPHHDFYYDPPHDIEEGGNRIATVIMYLSDVAEGGETAFPSAEKTKNQSKGDNLSDCAKKAGFAVKPRKGDALLFFSLHLNATPDHLSEHRSCPVIKGEKWSAIKWIRVRHYYYDIYEIDDACTDKDDRCADWASSGECKKNPAYMVGTDALPGHCKKSCDAC